LTGLLWSVLVAAMVVTVGYLVVAAVLFLWIRTMGG
jgi:hypothetical protein